METNSSNTSVHRSRAVTEFVLLTVGVVALAFLPPLLNGTGPVGWLLAVVSGGLLVFLLWRQLAGFDALRELLGQEVETLQSEKKILDRRLRDGERLASQGRSDAEARAKAWDLELSTLTGRMEAEARRAATAEAALEEVRGTLARLLRENSDLANERAEAVARRQILQKQYSDLDRTAAEIQSAQTEKAGLHRQALTELDRLRADLKDLRAEVESARGEAARVKGENDTLRMELNNTSLREARWKAEATDWRARTEAAENECRKVRANTALQEELATRRHEIDQLCRQIEELTGQRDLAVSRGLLLEQERDDLAAQLPPYKEQIERMDRVIVELQDECRNARQEPRHEMDRHFVWKLNFFKEREVLLSFLNEGVAVDLVGLRTEPQLPAEIQREPRLLRGAEGRIRIAASTEPLPREFLLRIRYTIYPQEALLRIRPYDSIKIERL